MCWPDQDRGGCRELLQSKLPKAALQCQAWASPQATIREGSLISLDPGQRRPLHTSLCRYLWAVIVACSGKRFQWIILRPLLFPYLILAFPSYLFQSPSLLLGQSKKPPRGTEEWGHFPFPAAHGHSEAENTAGQSPIPLLPAPPTPIPPLEKAAGWAATSLSPSPSDLSVKKCFPGIQPTFPLAQCIPLFLLNPSSIASSPWEALTVFS